MSTTRRLFGKRGKYEINSYSRSIRQRKEHLGERALGRESTWAREHAQKTGALIACRDDLRFMLTGADGWREYTYPFDSSIEILVTFLQKSIFYRGRDNDRDVIIADTNLNASIRKDWMLLAEDNNIEFVIVDFRVSLHEAIYRDQLRGNFSVGEEVIKRQYKQWQAYIASAVEDKKQLDSLRGVE